MEKYRFGKRTDLISMILRIGDLKREHNMKKPVVFSIQKWKHTDLENKQIHHHKFVEFFPWFWGLASQFGSLKSCPHLAQLRSPNQLEPDTTRQQTTSLNGFSKQLLLVSVYMCYISHKKNNLGQKRSLSIASGLNICPWTIHDNTKLYQ